jgi:hypothetical protein
MELTGNPLWKIKYVGSDSLEHTHILNVAQDFVSKHEVVSITFHVNMLLTEPGKGGLERDFNEREMTKEELLSLNQKWVEETMEEAAKDAEKHWGLGG